MSELLQKAIAEVSKLSEQEQDELASWILKKIAYVEDEAKWEEEIVTEALGSALKPDGGIDFDKLRATGITLTLDELYTENDEHDGP